MTEAKQHARPHDPAAKLGVSIPSSKKKKVRRAVRVRKEKAAEKGQAALERLQTKLSKKESRQAEKEKWKSIY